MSEQNPSSVSKDAFHLERSRFIDAFAALEEAIIQSPKLRMDEKLDQQIKAFRLIRNDLVHAQLKFVQYSGQLHALAVNSQHIADRAPLARLVKLDDLKSLHSDLVKLTKSSCQLSPSSPTKSASA